MKNRYMVATVTLIPLMLAGCGGAEGGGANPTAAETVIETAVVTETVEVEAATETVTETVEVTQTVESEPEAEAEEPSPAPVPDGGVTSGDFEVEVLDCYFDANWDGVVADITITNNGDGTPEWVGGTIEVLDAEGTRIEELIYGTELIAPGQTVNEQAMGFDNHDVTEFTCEVLSVDSY